MKLAELVLLYGLVGIGCALVVIATSAASPATRAADALLLLLFWPLSGPFLLARGVDATDPSSQRELSFLLVLRKAAGTPLPSLLPDENTARELARRLRVAAGKIEEIDLILKRPEFDERKAHARHQELRNRGASECALSTASIRIQNIRRLRALRDRFARELDEVGELIA